MKGIHLILILLFGAAAFIFWRMLRGNQGGATRAYAGAVPWGADPFEKDPKASSTSKSINSFSAGCNKAMNAYKSSVDTGGKYVKAPAVVTGGVKAAYGAVGTINCGAVKLLEKAAKPVIKAARDVGKAIGKGTVTAVKESVSVVKSGALVAGKEFKAITKSPTAFVKSTPKLALAPILAPTQVATKLAGKVAGAKVGKAVTIVAAPVVIPTKVAAKAVTTAAKVTQKAAGKVASGVKSVAKKLKFW